MHTPVHTRNPRPLRQRRGVPWARIGEFVGQRNLAVTANVYSHVLTDETEFDYKRMLSRTVNYS